MTAWYAHTGTRVHTLTYHRHMYTCKINTWQRQFSDFEAEKKIDICKNTRHGTKKKKKKKKCVKFIFLASCLHTEFLIWIFMQNIESFII